MITLARLLRPREEVRKSLRERIDEARNIAPTPIATVNELKTAVGRETASSRRLRAGTTESTPTSASSAAPARCPSTQTADARERASGASRHRGQLSQVHLAR